MTIFRHRITGPGPAGDIWVTGLFSSGTASIDTAHSAWHTASDSFFVGTMVPLWSTQLEASELITDELDAAGRHNVAQRRSTITYKGTGAGAQLEQRQAVVCGLRTATPTRAGRGRMFVPAPAGDSLVANGLLSTIVADNISSDLATALGTMSQIVQVVIFHRPPAPAVTSSTPVTSVTVGQVLGTQRRRTNKVPADYQENALSV